MENTIEFDEYRKCMEDIVYFTKYCYLNTVDGIKTLILNDYQINYIKLLLNK